jgi:hypothetical protein
VIQTEKERKKEREMKEAEDELKMKVFSLIRSPLVV